MTDMARQWDELARINAAYSIASLPEFEGRDAERLEAFWRSGRGETERLLDVLALGDTAGSTLVEIGCGIGRMTQALAARFGRVIALDVSPEMVRRARDLGSRLTNVEFRVGSGRDLAGIPDGSADFVLSWFVFQHLPSERDVLEYVRETGRVLGPGGRALLHMRTSRHALDHALRRIERAAYYAVPGPLRRAMGGAGDAHLDREFAARFRVWRGCAVRTPAVERVARTAGLRLTAADPQGGRFTCFQFVKEGARASNPRQDSPGGRTGA